MKRLVLTTAALAILSVAPALAAPKHGYCTFSGKQLSLNGCAAMGLIPGRLANDPPLLPLGSSSAALTGGGSSGYNDSVLRDNGF
jgi:hypothetical protein